MIYNLLTVCSRFLSLHDFVSNRVKNTVDRQSVSNTKPCVRYKHDILYIYKMHLINACTRSDVRLEMKFGQCRLHKNSANSLHIL